MSVFLPYLNLAVGVLVSVVLAFAFDFLVRLLTLTNDKAVGGWFLFTLFVWSILFFVRKRLSTLKLGSAYLWSVAHNIVALAAFIFFLGFHANEGLPRGGFNLLLYLSFLSLMLSGLMLIVFNRLAPRMFREKYAKQRASFGSLISRRGELELKFNGLIFSALEQEPEPALMESLLAVQAFLEKRSIVRKSGKAGFEKLTQTVGFKINDQAESLTKALDELLSINRQLSDQFWLKLLLSFHVSCAFVCLVFVLFHIALVVVY